MDKEKFANRSIAISSILVSLLALVFTVYQGYETRRHNRLSLLPHIFINYYLNEAETGKTGVEIVNDGVGPAVITNFRVFYDGKKIVDDVVGTEKTTWFGIHRLLWPEEKWIPRYGYPRPGAFVQSQLRFFALEIPSDRVPKGSLVSVFCRMKPLKIQVSYVDVYGNNKNVASGELFVATAEASKNPTFQFCSRVPTSSGRDQ